MTESGNETAELLSGLDAAVDRGNLPNPRHEFSTEETNNADSINYKTALKIRLIRLGYLKSSAIPKKAKLINTAFKDAVKRFQVDAGALDENGQPDGWAGPKTWEYMDCIVSFEEKQQPDTWPIPNPTSNPAVHRAVYLRLHTMGFFPNWERKIQSNTNFNLTKNEYFRRALHSFRDFCKTVDIAVGTSDNQFDMQDINAVFGHDLLIEQVAKMTEFDQLHRSFPQVLEGLARIELWMLGYDVEPGKDQFRTSRSHTHISRLNNKKTSKTSRAIKEFSEDCTERLGGDHPATLSSALFKNFFSLATSEEGDIHLEDNIALKFNDILETDEHRAYVKRSFSNFASNIWDGCRRVIKWLFQVVKTAVKTTYKLITNLVRYVSRQARKYYMVIVKSIQIVHAELTYHKGKPICLVPNRVYSTHDGDFDQYLFVDKNTCSNDLKNALQQKCDSVFIYTAGTRVLSLLFEIFRLVIKMVSTSWSWLLALLTLVKLGKRLIILRREVVRIHSYLIDSKDPESFIKGKIS